MASTAANVKEKGKPTVKGLLSDEDDVVASFLAAVYEESAWVAEEFVAVLRGTASSGATTDGIETVSDLAKALKSIVDGSSHERRLALLRAHPDLCEKVAKLSQLSKESQEEQSRSGLQSLTDEERGKFEAWNAEYRVKFGFPFILAVRNATKYTVLAALEGRVRSDSTEREFAIAMEQVHKIAWMRLLAAFDLSDAKGFLTCHVLDTANGCPGTRSDLCLLSFWPFMICDAVLHKFPRMLLTLFLLLRSYHCSSMQRIK